jgi:type IV pilus assembly protein PilA
MQETLRRMREERKEDDRGFTLIELLVVVVIIGVLIAIAIPLYLNYRKGAENKSAASDLRGAISTIEQCFSDNSSVYPTSWTQSGSSGTFVGCGTPNAAINSSSGTSLAYYPDATKANYMLVSFHGTTASNNGVFYCYASQNGGSVKTESANITAFATAGCP